MGFLQKIFGQKLVGTVAIKFYGEDEASVEYETEITDKVRREADLMHLFTLYYSKMLFNLNRGETADQLIVYIQTAVENTMGEGEINRGGILAYPKKLVAPKTSGVSKKYSGELYEESDRTRIILTHISWGGEGYYIPVSTVMCLQYLINNLTENSLMFLFVMLSGMNKYYREIGDYSKIRSIMEAPTYGYNYAVQILKGGE